MTRLITYGTFDMFHVGHLNLLKNLKSMADEVIVGVSTDEFNSKKGKKTLIPFEQRAKIVSSIRYVDQVLPENNPICQRSCHLNGLRGDQRALPRRA